MHVWLPLIGIWLRDRWKRGERDREREEGGMD
jgi:hypothetical protein